MILLTNEHFRRYRDTKGKTINVKAKAIFLWKQDINKKKNQVKPLETSLLIRILISKMVIHFQLDNV